MTNANVHDVVKKIVFAVQIVTAILIVIALLLGSARGAAVPSYSVQPTPDFALIGGNVSFSVSGVPLTYVFLMLQPQNDTNDTTLADRFQQLDHQGLGVINVSIPVDAEPGTYIASVMVEGAEVANCTVEVVFDYEIWSKAKIAEQDEQISEYSNETTLLRQEVAALKAGNSGLLWTAGAMLVAVFVLVLVVVKLIGPTLRLYIAEAKRKDEADRNMKQRFLAMLADKPYGNKFMVNPGQEEACQHLIEKAAASRSELKGAVLFMEDKNAEAGYRAYPVEDLAQALGVQEKPERAPAPAEDVIPKKSKRKAKPDPLAATLEVKPLKEKRRFGFPFHRRKDMDDDDEVPMRTAPVEAEEEEEEDEKEHETRPARPAPRAKATVKAEGKPEAKKSAPRKSTAKKPAKPKAPAGEVVPKKAKTEEASE